MCWEAAERACNFNRSNNHYIGSDSALFRDQENAECRRSLEFGLRVALAV